MSNLSSKLEISEQHIALWKALIGLYCPTLKQFLIWQVIYDQSTVERGIEGCAVWYSKTRRYRWVSGDDLIRYASGVMANIKRSNEAAQ